MQVQHWRKLAWPQIVKFHESKLRVCRWSWYYFPTFLCAWDFAKLEVVGQCECPSSSSQMPHGPYPRGVYNLVVEAGMINYDYPCGELLPARIIHYKGTWSSPGRGWGGGGGGWQERLAEDFNHQKDRCEDGGELTSAPRLGTFNLLIHILLFSFIPSACVYWALTARLCARCWEYSGGQGTHDSPLRASRWEARISPLHILKPGNVSVSSTLITKLHYNRAICLYSIMRFWSAVLCTAFTL